jgi:tellurium resistance protein TerD
MAVNLTKGQRVDISLQKMGVGLGWDPNTAGSGPDFDLDASAFVLDASGQVPSEGFFVFYNSSTRNPPGSRPPDGKPISPDGAVESSGDDRTGGSSDGDDETLSLDLSKIDPRIEQIIFTVTIDQFEERRQNFGQVKNSFIRIYDAASNEEICKYELDEDFSVETAVEFGRLYKRGGSWRFEAIGTGHSGGLGTFVSKYAKQFS